MRDDDRKEDKLCKGIKNYRLPELQFLPGEEMIFAFLPVSATGVLAEQVPLERDFLLSNMSTAHQ